MRRKVRPRTCKQHGKISRQAAHSTPHQARSQYLHLTDSRFSQDNQERDNPSSFSHDTRPFPHSDAITSVDLTTWGPNVRRDDRWTRLKLLLWSRTRGRVARASQVWQDGKHDRTSDVLTPHLSTTEGGESICQVRKLLEMPAKTRDGEARLLEGGKDPTRESSGKRRRWPGGWKSRRTGPSDPHQDGLSHEPWFPHSNR